MRFVLALALSCLVTGISQAQCSSASYQPVRSYRYAQPVRYVYVQQAPIQYVYVQQPVRYVWTSPQSVPAIAPQYSTVDNAPRSVFYSQPSFYTGPIIYSSCSSGSCPQ